MILMMIIVLMKIVWCSDNPSSKLCVYGSSMRDAVNSHYSNYIGIQGEYTLDSNGNEYWSMPIGGQCIYWHSLGDTFYIRKYSNNQWQISLDPVKSAYIYGCDIEANLPSDCGNNWDGAYGVKEDFYILDGECPDESNNKLYLNVTNYPDYWQGCNGKFIAVDGKPNLFNRTEIYHYDGWTVDVPHYWLYSITEQEWFCERSLFDDYSNGCYGWTKRYPFNMTFYNEN